MTKSEFYEKYGDVEVTFVGYSKNNYSYHATLPDGNILCCEYGGWWVANDLYRHNVNPRTINNLQPHSARVYKNKLEVESYRES